MAQHFASWPGMAWQSGVGWAWLGWAGLGWAGSGPGQLVVLETGLLDGEGGDQAAAGWLILH
eukprot:8656869-Alexandrium_andersonii.AAC.1